MGLIIKEEAPHQWGEWTAPHSLLSQNMVFRVCFCTLCTRVCEKVPMAAGAVYACEHGGQKLVLGIFSVTPYLISTQSYTLALVLTGWLLVANELLQSTCLHTQLLALG